MHVKFLVARWYKLSGGNRETLFVVIQQFGVYGNSTVWVYVFAGLV